MSTNETHSNDGPGALGTTTSDGGSTEPGNSSPDAETRLTEPQKLDAISALLAGAPPPDVDPAPAEGDEVQGGGDGQPVVPEPEDLEAAGGDPEAAGQVEQGDTPLTPADLADKLDLPVDQVYEMDIPTGDGEVVKLGDLKDHWQNQQRVERESAERTAQLDEREARIITDQQVWSVLAMKGQLPPQALREAQQQVQSSIQAETDKLLNLVPDFQDEAKMDTFRREAVRALGTVGFKPHEVMMADHRHALFVRRFLQLEAENKALKKKSEPKPPRAGKPNGRQSAKQRSVPANASTYGPNAGQVGAITKLISGG